MVGEFYRNQADLNYKFSLEFSEVNKPTNALYPVSSAGVFII